MINEKFLDACKKNDVKKAKDLFERYSGLKIDVNKTNNFGKTPIYHSIETQSIQSIKFLISVGVDLQKTSVVSVKSPLCTETEFNKYNEPPLVTAARVGNLISLELLMANGCNGNEFATLIKDLHTPKDIETINKEEDEEMDGNNKFYAINYAVFLNNPRIVETLLLNGAKTEVKDHYDRTPMHYVCICKKSNQMYCQEQRKILLLLLLYRANPHVTDRLSVTPLALAINNACLSCVKCILSVRPIPPYQLSMIGLATLKNHQEIVVRLILGGFKLNLQNSRLETSIQTDIFHQPFSSISTILIFHGCDVNCFQRPIHMRSLLYHVMRGFRLDCESIAFFLVKTGYNLNQDPWLLESPKENLKKQPSRENIFDNKSRRIQAKQFFNQDTIARYGSFDNFPIYSLRMNVLKNYLIENLRNPLSLCELCRIRTRRCLSDLNGGVSVVAAINSMILPPQIIYYLLLSDIAKEQSNGSVNVFHPF